MRRRNESKAAIATEQEPGLDLSSLIDVSFLLLIYFLVTMTLRVPDADLAMTLPGKKLGEPTIDFIDEPPVIGIQADGQITYSDELVESGNTSRHLPVPQSRQVVAIHRAAARRHNYL